MYDDLDFLPLRVTWIDVMGVILSLMLIGHFVEILERFI